MTIMKYLKIMFLAVLAAVSCQKLDYPEADSSNSLTSLKCFVYYDTENLKIYQELDVLSGTFNEAMGAINFQFPTDGSKHCDLESLKRCRLEATIPSTARLVETDASGNETGNGIGGMRDLSAARTTIYFKVVAADGTEKRYQVTFRYENQ